MKVAFYKSKKHLFNRLVSWWTNGPYSHVELVLETLVHGYECASASGMDGGVRLKLMDLPAESWDIIEFPASTLAAREWFRQHERQEYDVLGLFGFVFRRGTQDKDKWFCSEAVAAALGYNDPWRYDPNTLYITLKGVQNG